MVKSALPKTFLVLFTILTSLAAADIITVGPGGSYDKPAGGCCGSLNLVVINDYRKEGE